MKYTLKLALRILTFTKKICIILLKTQDMFTFIYIFNYTFNRILAIISDNIETLIGLFILDRFKRLKISFYILQTLQRYKVFYTGVNQIRFFHLCMKTYPLLWFVAFYSNTLYFYAVLIGFTLSVLILIHITFINTNFMKRCPLIWTLVVTICRGIVQRITMFSIMFFLLYLANCLAPLTLNFTAGFYHYTI